MYGIVGIRIKMIRIAKRDFNSIKNPSRLLVTGFLFQKLRDYFPPPTGAAGKVTPNFLATASVTSAAESAKRIVLAAVG